jgi:hypothetical protein
MLRRRAPKIPFYSESQLLCTSHQGRASRACKSQSSPRRRSNALRPHSAGARAPTARRRRTVGCCSPCRRAHRLHHLAPRLSAFLAAVLAPTVQLADHDAPQDAASSDCPVEGGPPRSPGLGVTSSLTSSPRPSAQVRRSKWQPQAFSPPPWASAGPVSAPASVSVTVMALDYELARRLAHGARMRAEMQAQIERGEEPTGYRAAWLRESAPQYARRT